MSDQSSDNIRKQMARIRHELDEDVEAVVDNAKELTDWRGFVKRHPILSISAAAAIGFFVVPRRLSIVSPDAETLEKLAKKNRLVVKPKPDVRRQAGMVSPILNLVSGALMRSAFTMAGQHLNKALAGSDNTPEMSAAENS